MMTCMPALGLYGAPAAAAERRPGADACTLGCWTSWLLRPPPSPHPRLQHNTQPSLGHC